ncbi:MAG: hypothetical protein HYS07_06925 [Chlamydiae bacterium]|nr:hypothetical protein [Chlamydiota bacterium]MBI3277515.1 hypothetical protein [Chlamydiota bacterium]
MEDISRSLGLSIPSTRVFCSRKTKSGEFIRARRDLYILSEAFKQWDERDYFILANVIQTPSYVSLTTALSYYELTTQLVPTLIESINPIRSDTYEVERIRFQYHFSQSKNYFGYEKKEGFFIAQPEKALLDSLYLLWLGRYALDENALHLKTIQWIQIEKWLEGYSERFKKFVKDWKKIHAHSPTT